MNAEPRTPSRKTDREPTDVVFDPGLMTHVSVRGQDRGPIELLNHLILSLEGDKPGGSPHLRNRQQTPLDSYYRSHQLMPGDSQDQRRLNRLFWVAGRRLRGAWDRAGLQPRLTANLMSTGHGGGSRDLLSAPESVIEARVDVALAVESLPPTPRVCVIAVCCTDLWAADWARRRPWPKPESAIDVLRIALEGLAEHYRHADRFASPAR